MAQSDPSNDRRPSTVALTVLRTTDAPEAVNRLRDEYGIQAELTGDQRGVYVTDPDVGEVLVDQDRARQDRRPSNWI